MKVSQFLYHSGKLDANDRSEIENFSDVHLVLSFGKKELLLDTAFFKTLKSTFPSAQLATCSTAGEIMGSKIYNDSILVTAVYFGKTSIKTAGLNMAQFSNSVDLGRALIRQLDTNNLKSILVFSDGLIVNGTQLVVGMEEGNGAKALITGGLAGDGIEFRDTVVGLNAIPEKGNVVAIGFYGSSLDVRSSSISGWDVFGPERIVTKAEGTRVYEIDNQSAIELYKLYLGPYINDQTNSTLLFPLAVKLQGKSHYFARSILSIDYDANCMIFAGDVPQGSSARFMKASFEKLIDAAGHAAKAINQDDSEIEPELAILISCVGRKTILDKQVEEEVAVIADYFRHKTALAGFYSYGEISPQLVLGPCELHNQTITITTFREV